MPDAPEVHHIYRSLTEAATWAQSLGVSVHYDARLDLANLANELLWQLETHSLALPDEIQIDPTLFKALGRMGIQSPASANKGRITINPDAFYWRDPIKIAAMQRTQKSWSSDHPLHPLFHEAGHVAVYKADPDRFETLRELTNAQKTVIAGEVSFRACLDAHEFTAEVFAGQMAGRTFSKDIMRWYRTRGGTAI